MMYPQYEIYDRALILAKDNNEVCALDDTFHKDGSGVCVEWKGRNWEVVCSMCSKKLVQTTKKINEEYVPRMTMDTLYSC